MTKTIIAVFTITSILLFSTMMVQEVSSEEDIPFPVQWGGTGQAIPDWVTTQFEWYINGEIDEKTLLGSMNWMFDNNVMHLSEKAAQEVQEMRNEINDLKLDLEARKGANESPDTGSGGDITMQGGSGEAGSTSMTDEFGRIKVQFPWGSSQEDINQFIDEMKKSIDSLSTEQQSHAISSLRTLVTIQPMHSTGDGDSKIEIGINLIEKVTGTPLDWGTVMVYAIPIDKKAQSIDAELKILEQWLEIISKEQETSVYDASDRLASGTTAESSTQYRESDLDFITRMLSSIDQEINALYTEIEVLEKKLHSVGDDAQLANIDLQNQLQKQQQTLQTMSNVSKMLHDTAKAIISNMRA